MPGTTNSLNIASQGTAYYSGSAFSGIDGSTAGFALVSNGTGVAPAFKSLASQPLPYSSVSTSPYVATATDYFISVTTTSTAITVQLPNAPTTGRVYVVKDKTGQAATNNITVTTVGGVVLLDGSTTYKITNAYQANNFLFDGTAWEVW